MEEISCMVQAMKFLCLKGESSSGCGLIDITFPTENDSQVSCISFDNFYTASLTIKGKFSGASKTSHFRTLIEEYTLMKLPHHANEAQTNFTIDLEECGCHGDERLDLLRFILHQPSPRWKSFCLKNIKVYRATTNQSQTNSEIDGIDVDGKSKSSTVEQYPVDRLSKHIKSIKDMVEFYRRLPEDFKEPGFEVNNEFNINELSYNP